MCFKPAACKHTGIFTTQLLQIGLPYGHKKVCPKDVIWNSGCMAELANVCIIHPRYLGSNLSTGRKKSHFVCVAFEYKSLGC
jgi:hypothetical protein